MGRNQKKTPEMYQNPVNFNGINSQPQLVRRISAINCIAVLQFWFKNRINLHETTVISSISQNTTRLSSGHNLALP